VRSPQRFFKPDPGRALHSHKIEQWPATARAFLHLPENYLANAIAQLFSNC
jgi:hypothetical protein